VKSVLIVTGPPQSGKTTLVERLISAAGIKAKGFITREIRKAKERTGFKIVMDDGRWAVLADVAFASGPRVGKYRVDIKGIEEMIRFFETAEEAPLYYVDEIGKMEMTHPRFAPAFEKFVKTRAGSLVVTVGIAYLNWSRSICSGADLIDLSDLPFEEGYRRARAWISGKISV
jgi:nucleoside-triphosphatase THEP1